MGSMAMEDPPKPWVETPCILSAPLSRAAGCNIYLKLENLQPSGSFKSRGIGNMMYQSVSNANHHPHSSSSSDNIHFYSSSGGNAGLAAATSALALGYPATIVVPTTTTPYMIQKLRDLHAEVIQTGANWGEADAYLRDVLLVREKERGGQGIYVPPFDHPDIWSGAATLVDELARQMDGVRVDGVVCNVGGGGLLCGLAEGLERWSKYGLRRKKPRVLAIETVGADKLLRSVEAGKLLGLDKVTSIATSLATPRITKRAYEVVRDSGGGIVCARVTDAEAVRGSVGFLEDARMLVEVACGATIATVYNGYLRQYLGEKMSDDEWSRQNIVLIVCGGSSINLELLNKYKEVYGV